jgi:hypothetical protein
MTATVTAVIVAFDDGLVLERCLRSLRDWFTGPIVVVDNASSDDTGEVASRLASELREVRVIHADVNSGYAAGVNLAREATDTTYLAVMNADCVVTGDWIDPCVEQMEAIDSIGACSPTVSLKNGSGLNAEGLTLHVAGFGFNRHLGVPTSEASHRAESVQGVQGTAFVIRSSALERLGGWYTGGFLYHEDVELSWSLRGAGYDIWFVPTPPIVHDYRLTMSAEKFFLLERNRVEMLISHLSIGSRILVFPVIIATELAVWAYAISKRSGLGGAKWRSYRSVIDRKAVRAVRRREVRDFRTLSDRELLKHMQLRYPRSQTGTLFSEETSSGRRGNREMPTE